MDPLRTVPTAQDAMRRDVFVFAPTVPILDAVRELVQRGFSGAPVVERDRLVGVFSERDALNAIASAQYEDEPPGTVVQHMRREFTVVAPTADLYEVASVFRESPVRRLPVVDDSRRLLGILSRGDVLKALIARFPHRQKTQYEKLQDHMALRLGASF